MITHCMLLRFLPLLGGTTCEMLLPCTAAAHPAAGPALVLVGTILLGHIAHIEWDDIGIAIPSFLTMILMPFTYSGG